MNNSNNQIFVNKLISLLNQQINRTSRPLHQKCVVFDIDGTLIIPDDNYHVIPAVYKFYEYCKHIKIPIIIVTARPGTDHNVKHTVDMLIKKGIVVDNYNFMNPELFHNNEQRKYKEEARQKLMNKYEILMSIGDMPFDVDTYCNIGVLVKYYNDNSINYIIGQNQ